MFKKNNGSDESHRLQNQFSAYLKKAVRNRRIRFLVDKARLEKKEQSLTDIEFALPDMNDMMEKIADYEALQYALKSIRDKERYIVLSRLVAEVDFEDIAKELGMTYKAVTCLYYRALKKLYQYMEGGEGR